MLLTIFAAACAWAQEPHLQLSGDLEGVHDPALIHAGGGYYLYSTGPIKGGHVPIRCSPDLHVWKLCGVVFSELPLWAKNEIPATETVWAPDISQTNGEYRLYYAISAFGKNTSVIGFLSNETLDPKAANYRWADHGLVIDSKRADDFNAIDPNIFQDRDGTVWLTLGSFWSGIKMIRIDPATGKQSTQDRKVYTLASRVTPPTPESSRPDVPSGGQGIEAPFLVRHGDSYYLFASYDFCCRGAESTYNVRVGRSSSVTGPYLDERGVPMTKGGGKPVILGGKRWAGPGHEAVLQDGDGKDYLVFHAYDGVTGKPSLHIAPILWKGGWPVVAPMPEK